MRALVLAAAVVLCRSETFYAAPSGDDANDGSRARPLRTLAACVGRLRAGGDECRLRAGRYAGPPAVLDGVSGTDGQRVVIAAVDDEDVVIDGTEEFTCDWVRDAAGLWTCATGPVQQLWVSGELQTLARWPDALWADRSVFNWTNWATFDIQQPWGPFPPGTPDPVTFYDSGRLAKADFNATGAMFVGVIGHMDTFVGTVAKHAPGAGRLDVQLHIPRIGNTKARNSIYYLENLPAFANQRSEWAYSMDEGRLWVNADTAPADTRRKVQTYALEVTKAQYVTLANLTFHGTTVNAHDHIDHMVWDSVAFEYHSASRRALGDYHMSSRTTMSQGKRVPGGYLTVRNCTFFGADGQTLNFASDHATFENNLFQHNDYATVDADGAVGLGGWVVDASKHTGDRCVRNTFIGNGPSIGYAAGAASYVALNYFEGQADLQNDGASVQFRSSSAVSSTLERNWNIRSAKGYRVDSCSNTAFCEDETNNTVRANVAFRAKGFMLKNDYNFYENNLALWAPGFPEHGARAAVDVLFTVDASRFAGENSHSVVEGNVASSHRDPVPGTTRPGRANVFHSGVGDELRDPENLDFRPVAGSNVSEAGAGPYAAVGTEYWIPGRQLYTASMPIPPHGTATARADADLMFLAASGCRRHRVYCGQDARGMRVVGEFVDANVVQLGGGALEAGGTYHWRVDAVDPAGGVRTGPVWRFTVRGATAPRRA